MRVAVALGMCSMTIVAVLASAQPPGGSGTPPGRPPAGGPGARAGFAPPPFPGDTAAAERDSLMRVVLQSIAGREQMPAESVFKDIQLFRGRPAGSIPQVMNHGFGRSLGVSCFHCHAKDDWAKDEKKQKRIARDMMKMVTAINTEHLWKIEGLGEAASSPPAGAGGPGRPTVNCSTCHRGSIRASADAPRPTGAGTRR